MTIETAQFNLTDSEQTDFKNLFRFILDQSRRQHLRGNIILSLDGNGRIKLKVESFHDLAAIGVNGNGAEKVTR